MEINETFEILGVCVGYRADSVAAHETITFDGITAVDRSGDRAGVWACGLEKEWAGMLELSGEQMETEKRRLIKNYLENFLCGFIFSALYRP